MAQSLRRLSRLKSSTLPLFSLFIIGLLTALPAKALESDANQPISVLAQSAEFNPDQGIAIYTGSVEIEQGSLKVKAHKVTVYRKTNGEIDKIIAEGQKERVHLQQQPNPEDPVVHAYAMNIDYLATLQQVELTRNAEIENGQDRFSGERIRYHLQTKRIQAWGQDSGESSPDNDGRVKIILFPNEGEQSQ